ncbi:hypothetical protein Nham_1611 [Nitrobacter hamburgensis X14]|uniref:Uncharacterized protein n=1 Tax=Nitrobacter hamburgensis (strain DSM 10229 / NCIMB 13809 / X14) TaxID=323097 RepID=Q1QMW7_NITHX|nr:hypothetical protein [Nitrobacter hamburgensis]ABE62430.1 hypothetical protein Nham_1611 [Nitrobacter hamburgensis X14]
MKSRLETELNCDFGMLDTDQRLNVIRAFAEAYQLAAEHFVVMNNAIEQCTRELALRTQSTEDAADIKTMHAQYIEVVNEYTREFTESLKASAGLLMGVLTLSGLQIDNQFPTVQ